MSAKIADVRFPGSVQVTYQDVASGRNDRRPGFRAMMGAIGAGQVGAVLVVHLDRIARNILDGVTFLESLERRGVALVLHSQGLDTSTAYGRLLANGLLLLAQFESDIIGERVARSHRAAREAGKKGPGLRPYGWTVDPAGNLAVSQREQEGISFASSMRATGSSWAAIAEALTRAAFVTVSGVPWSAEQTRGTMLRAFSRRTGGSEPVKNEK